MIWIEDHKNMVNIDIYKEIFKQMQISNSDYMNYTWWFLGKVYKMYSNIHKEDFGDIETFDLTYNINKKLRLENRKPYIISLPSFFSKKIIFQNFKKK